MSFPDRSVNIIETDANLPEDGKQISGFSCF